MCPGRLSGWDPPQNPYVDSAHHLSRRRAYSLGGTLISQHTQERTGGPQREGSVCKPNSGASPETNPNGTVDPGLLPSTTWGCPGLRPTPRNRPWTDTTHRTSGGWSARLTQQERVGTPQPYLHDPWVLSPDKGLRLWAPRSLPHW